MLHWKSGTVDLIHHIKLSSCETEWIQNLQMNICQQPNDKITQPKKLTQAGTHLFIIQALIEIFSPLFIHRQQFWHSIVEECNKAWSKMTAMVFRHQNKLDTAHMRSADA